MRASLSVVALLTLLLPGAMLRAQEQPLPRRSDVITQRQPGFGKVELFTSRRARLGVQVSPAAPTDSIGALIQFVTPGGPADKAGIQPGDIILRVNGQSLLEGNIRVSRGQSAPGLALSLIAASINPGDSVILQYQRGKDRRITTLIAGDEPGWDYRVYSNLPFGEVPTEEPFKTLDELPDIRMRMDGPQATYTLRSPMARVFMLGSPLAELVLAPVNPQLGRYFGATDGVLVINLPPESHLGLKPGDVVLAVDGRQVKVPSQLIRVLQSYDPGEGFKLEIMRMKKKETVNGQVDPPK